MEITGATVSNDAYCISPDTKLKKLKLLVRALKTGICNVNVWNSILQLMTLQRTKKVAAFQSIIVGKTWFVTQSDYTSQTKG